MNYTLVIAVVLIIIVLYYIIAFITDTSVKILSNQDAKDRKDGIHPAVKKDAFTYSVWFNVRSWDTKDIKNIYTIKSNSDSGEFLSLNLERINNTLKIKVKDNVDIPITDIPIQRWVNIIVSGGSNTIDIYYNGKLISTKVVQGMSFETNAINGDNKVEYETNNPTWQGTSSKFEYYPRRLNPQDAWNIYSEGFGGSTFGSLMNRYRMKVAFIKDDIEYNSFVL